MLALCPWLGWKGGVRNKKAVAGLALFFLAAAAGLWLYGVRIPTALAAAAGALACLAGILALFTLEAPLRRRRTALAAYGVRQEQTPSMALIEAALTVSRDGRKVGTLTPQRRLYRKFDSPFAEVSTLPGLGDEIYATLLAVDTQDNVTLKVSVNPLVNWVWIGGALMSLFPLLGLTRRRGRKE
jgi:cytochrome c-type biogenesis protein CcmF